MKSLLSASYHPFIFIHTPLSIKKPLIHHLALAISLVTITQAHAQSVNPEQIANNQVQLQQQRDAARNEALVPTPSVKIDTTSLVKADTTKVLTFNNRGFKSELSGTDSSYITAGTGTDHDNVVIVGHAHSP